MILLVQQLPPAIIFTALLNWLWFLLNHLGLRCIDSGKGINDLDDSVLKVDLGQLVHGIVLEGGKVVVYLEGLAFLCG